MGREDFKTDKEFLLWEIDYEKDMNLNLVKVFDKKLDRYQYSYDDDSDYLSSEIDLLADTIRHLLECIEFKDKEQNNDVENNHSSRN